MSNLILVRGLSGCGKTTLAETLVRWDGIGKTLLVSADDYFTQPDGVYCFNASKLKEAHEWCQLKAQEALTFDCEMVVVHNTFSCRWELQPYLRMAKQLNAQVTVVDLFDNGFSDSILATRNKHNVPEQTIKAMRARWEHDWLNGDPRPPWERR